MQEDRLRKDERQPGTFPVETTAGKAPAAVIAHKHIVLFDGVCNLCSRTLRFVASNDVSSVYKFAWVQSEEGKEILRWCGLPDDRFDTMVTVDEGTAYLKSTAFLRVTRHLRFPWMLLSVGFVIPRFLRDVLYGWLATRRYSLFGRTEQCSMPDARLRDRFLHDLP
jgi:predicted DCC family thiol-disulfide oxidoreductase YuxK